MGFDELVLVDPADRGVLNRKKAIDGASGARGILEKAKIEDSLAAALQGFDLCCATGMPTDMARARTQSIFQEPRAFFTGLKGDIGSVALVFGNVSLEADWFARNDATYAGDDVHNELGRVQCPSAVSYTHLTLTTKA